MKAIASICTLLAFLGIQAQTHVKIIHEKDGQRTVIEKELNEGEEFDLDEYLNGEGFDIDALDLGDGRQEIEIIIGDDSGGQLRQEQECKPKAFLGIVPKSSSQEEGVRIANVIQGSSAESMGLREGDLITKFNGVSIAVFQDLVDAIGTHEVGDRVSVSVQRDGRRENLSGNLSEDPRGQFHLRFPGEQSLFEYHQGEAWEEMMEELEKRMEAFKDIEFEFDEEQAEEWTQRLEEEVQTWAKDFEQEIESIIDKRMVIVVIEDIERDEADLVNRKAEPRLRIEDDLKLAELRFFPNPGDGRFELAFSTPQRGDLDIMLFDAQGRKVYYEMLGDFEGEYQNEIDISKRPSGSYFLQIMQGGQTYSRKIIKQ